MDDNKVYVSSQIYRQLICGEWAYWIQLNNNYSLGFPVEKLKPHDLRVLADDLEEIQSKKPDQPHTKEDYRR